MKKAKHMTTSAHTLVLALTLSVLAAIPALAEAPRDAVAIVRPKLEPEGKRFYESLAALYRTPEKAPLEGFSALARGTSWASGFLVKDRDGTVLFVTTKRALGFASAVSLEFTTEAGESRVLADCPVAWRDTDADFAVISLPDPAALGDAAIALADAAPGKGAEVWSAGYSRTGKGDTPAWNLTKGLAGDRTTALDAFAFPEAATAVAHTARFDPGSSGGPLLSGDPANPRSLRVVGINALGPSGPDAGNAALSAEALKAAIARYRASAVPAVDGEKAVTARVGEFLKGIALPEIAPKMAYRFVSYRFAETQGFELLSARRNDSLRNHRADIDPRFALGNAIDPVREVLYGILYDELHDRAPAVLVDVKAVPGSDGQSFASTIAVGTNQFTLDWELESGNYMIVGGKDLTESAILNEGKPKRPEVRTGHASRGFLITGGTTALPRKDGWGYRSNFAFGYLAGIASWLTIGGKISIDAGTAPIIDNFQDDLQLYELTFIMNLQPVAAKGYLASRGLFPYATIQPSVGEKRFIATDNGTEREAAISAGIGLQYCRTYRFSLGFEMLARIQLLDEASPRLNAFPIRLFLTL
jgi:hypothetical protein